MHAGVSQRTFFRYFASKEEVLLDWLDSYNVKICQSLRQRQPEESDIEALRRGLDHYGKIPKEESDRAALVNRLALTSSTLRGRLLSKMAEWEERIAWVLSERAEREPAGDFRAKLLAGFVMSILNTAFRESGKNGVNIPVANLIDQGFTFLVSDGEVIFSSNCVRNGRSV
jgi:AcrR family transcriptional regulator